MKDQNWFAVAVDVVIVVVGILLAFQITEWNASRKDTALDKDILSRIKTEFRRDKKRISRPKLRANR